MDDGFGLNIEYGNQDISVLDTSEACCDALDNFNDSWGDFSNTLGGWVDNNDITTGDLFSSAVDTYMDHEVYTEVCDIGLF